MQQRSSAADAGGGMISLGGFVLLVVAVAASGTLFSPGAWYQALAKPAWTPPNWIFAIAWSLLYPLIAVAGWLVWRQVGLRGARFGFSVYGLQLLLNAAWSWLFFDLHRIDLALLDVVALWITILLTILAFRAARPLAAWLLLPYLLWVAYATALNLAIWRLNP